MIQTISPVLIEQRDHYAALAEDSLRQAVSAGASQAEIRLGQHTGFSVNVRMGQVEKLEHHRSRGLTLTVYLEQKADGKVGFSCGSASTTDLSAEAIRKTVLAAMHIARQTQPDPAAGLADTDRLARDIPDLELYHPWSVTPLEAVELAKRCEAQGLAVDKHIHNSEGAGLTTHQGITLYANTHAFMGVTTSTRHSLHCILLAKDEQGGMQRDGSHTVSRDPKSLWSVERVAKEAGERTVRRLGARRLKTCSVPVIFQSEVASSLISYFLAAISGGALYRQASFLLDRLGQPVFAPCIQIVEHPHLKKGLGSAPFDAEGVETCGRDLVTDGVLQGYLLSSYSARRLGMQTTGNAGGAHNILVKPGEEDLSDLLQQMNTGLLLTELMGDGVNLVTGDYSQGAAGFWVAGGEIQYPVEEITVAGNLKDMYQQILAVAQDVDPRSPILTGSILVENMMVAGE